MNHLLIIRSAPIQQLDANLPFILKKFGKEKTSVLTHEHGLQLVKKYREVEEVIPYPFRQSFSIFRKAVLPTRSKFEDVVVLVGNISGCGFFNVLLFSLSIPAKRRWVCNLVGEIRPSNSMAVIGLGFRNALYSLAACTATALCSLPLILLLPVFLGNLVKRDV